MDKKKRRDIFDDYRMPTKRLFYGDQHGRAGQELASSRWAKAGMDNPNPLPEAAATSPGGLVIPSVDGGNVMHGSFPPQPGLYPAYEVYDQEYVSRGLYPYGVIIANWNTLEPIRYIPQYNKKRDGTWDYDNPNYTVMPSTNDIYHYTHSQAETTEFEEETFGNTYCCGYGSGVYHWGRNQHFWFEDNGETIFSFDGTVDEIKTRWGSWVVGEPHSLPCYAYWVWDFNDTGIYAAGYFNDFGASLDSYESVAGNIFRTYNLPDGHDFHLDLYEVIKGYDDCYAYSIEDYSSDFTTSADLYIYLDIGKGFESCSQVTANFSSSCSGVSCTSICSGNVSGSWACPYLCGFYYKKDIPQEEMSNEKKDEVMLYVVDYWDADGFVNLAACSSDIKQIVGKLTYGMATADKNNKSKYVTKDYERAIDEGGNHWFLDNDGKIEGTPEEARWYDYQWMVLVKLNK